MNDNTKKKTWRVWAESEPIPADEWSQRVDLLLEALGRFEQALGPAGWGTGTSLGAVFEIETDVVQEAVATAVAIFSEALKTASEGLEGGVEIRRLEISESDFEPLDLLGASDVARVLGVSRQRVYQMMESSDFPRPTAKLARGAVWSRREVESWRDRYGPNGWWKVELTLRVKVAPPRVRVPSAEKRSAFVRVIEEMGSRGGVVSEARWLKDAEVWVSFSLQANSERRAIADAIKLVKHKASNRPPELAVEADLEITIDTVRSLEVETVA